MKARQDGFAIVVVVLSTMIIFVTLLITISITTMGSRTGSAQEGQSYQALLAADSGASSFVSRVREGGFKGTVYNIECWVQGWSKAGACPTGTTANLTTLYLTSATTGPRADVTVVDTQPSASTITIKSVGQVGGTAGTVSQATVIQKINLFKPPFLNVSVPAALTSCPGITGGGTANLTGSATNGTGIIPNFATVLSASPSIVSASMVSSTASGSGWPATITVDNATYLDTGSVIRLGSSTKPYTYRVTGKPTSNTLTIEPAYLTADTTTQPLLGASLTGTLDLIPIAFRAFATPNSGSSTYRIPVSDPTSVFLNDVLYFTKGTTDYGLTVVAKDFEGGDLTKGYVDVTLGATGAGANLYDSSGTQLPGSVPPPSASDLTGTPPGTPLRRYVPGATSAGSIGGTSSGVVPKSAWSGASTVSPAAIAGSLTVKCGDALFAQVFNNYTKAQYYGLVPTANRLSSITPSAPLSKDIYWLGPQATPSSSTFTLNGNDLCGSGILVVNGDLTMKGTGNLNAGTCQAKSDGKSPDGFTGVIYVIGNFSNTGNSVIHGSVVVEGNVSISSTSLGGSMTIDYDPKAVLSSAQNLSPVTFKVADGSWSQQ